jgi:hypothetical protein
MFRVQQRFGKSGPFLSFLESRDVRQSIPSHSEVWWYRSNAVFSALLKLWDHISAFALPEHIVLNDNMKINLQILAQFTGQFSDAGKSLEGNALGTVNLFIGTLCAIRYNIEKLRQQQPAAVAVLERRVDDFTRKSDREYHFLLMMTFLDPSVQFKTGRHWPLIICIASPDDSR